MVILDTADCLDHLVGVQNTGSVYIWDLKRAIDRQCNSKERHGTSTYAPLTKHASPDEYFFRAESIESNIVLCGHDSIKITNMPSLLVKNDSLLSVLTFPGDGEIFSCMAVQEKSLAVGCSSGAVRLYDLESQTRTILDLQIPQQLTQNYSKSMVVGIGVLGSFQLIVATKYGSIFQVDLRTGKKSLQYQSSKLGTQISPVVGLQVRDRHVYICHQHYISKWYAGIAGFAGIVQTGFECQTVRAFNKGLLIGGNLPEIYFINQIDQSYKKWDTSSPCVFSIKILGGFMATAGVGKLVDIHNQNQRVCSFLAE